MKTPVVNCQSKPLKKFKKKFQSTNQSKKDFQVNKLLETSGFLALKSNQILFQALKTLASLKSDIKIQDQTQKCGNKLCKNFSLQNQQETIEITFQNLCQICRIQYNNQSYCLHCKQVYFDNTDDGKQWIMCEVCQKWVHTLCAQLTIKECLDISFKCFRCKKGQNQITSRKNSLRGQAQKGNQKKPYDFLNTLGFSWQLKTEQMSNDLQLIKKQLNQH